MLYTSRASSPLARLRKAAAFAFLGAAALAAHAEYPDKPIQMILSFPPGGATDILARAVGQKMTETLKQTIVVDNRPGAGGNIGLLAAGRAAPDGYTIYMAAVTNAAIAAAAYPPQAIHLQKDFVPIAEVAIVPHMLVVPASVPAKDVKQLVALFKSQPGKHNFASQGAGTLSHLESELFKAATGVEIQHIPYKGSSQALPDLISGRASMMFDSIPASMPNVKAGKLRVLAVASGHRMAMLPEVPTVAEAGVKGFSADNVFGLMAPKGTPPQVIAALEKAVHAAVESPELKQRLEDQGVELRYTPSAAFGKLVDEEFHTWGQAVQKANVKLQ